MTQDRFRVLEEKYNKEELLKRLHETKQLLAQKKELLKESEDILLAYESQFQAINRQRIWRLVQSAEKKKQMIQPIRREIRGLLENYKFYLYELGFVDRVLDDLEKIFETTTNRYIKQIVAWELVLWHAQEDTFYGANQALTYLPFAVKGVKDSDQLEEARKIKKKCTELLNKDRVLPSQVEHASRHLDVVIAADFRMPLDRLQSTIEEIKLLQTMGLQIGLMQLSTFDFNLPKVMQPEMEKLVDGENVQLIQSNEKITCEMIFVKHLSVLEEKQRFLPKIAAYAVRVVMDEEPNQIRNLRQCLRNLVDYFGKLGKWYPASEQIRRAWEQNDQIRFVKLTSENWISVKEQQAVFRSFVEEGMLEDNPYTQ